MWAFHWMECPGAGTPQCARCDGRQRRLVDFSFYARTGVGPPTSSRQSYALFAARLWFNRPRGQVIVLGPRSPRGLMVRPVDGKSDYICHPTAPGRLSG
jgi:hypothetical protein